MIPADPKAAALTLIPALQRHACIELFGAASELHHLPRLGDLLGIRLLVKRDDCLPLGMGGNKVRQLEYYLGPARDQRADTVLITGAIQSNFTRTCAAAARKLGWHPVVQLEQRVPRDDALYTSSGNVLLTHLLGAEIHNFAQGEHEAAADANLDRLAEQHRQRGQKPYVVHLGLDHPPLGGLGYVRAAAEISTQLEAMNRAPDHVVIPSGSGLTHAGFLCGARALGWPVRVHGICVRRDAEMQRDRITRRTAEIDAMLDLPETPAPVDIHLHDTVLAPGYGQMNAAVTEAIHLAARHEGLFLDPVYSGRAFAGLIDLTRRGVIRSGETVVFLHTGGLPALFAYQNDLTAG